jgi:hypothetical protein
MRLTSITCVKKDCMNTVRSGFRFCYRKDCGLNTSQTTPKVEATNEEE